MENNVFTIGSYAWVSSFYSDVIPDVGETVIANSFSQAGGGKGTTQSYGASFYGCKVKIISRVGDDEPGNMHVSLCKKAGIGTEYINLDPQNMTGRCSIFKNKQGDNCISIFPGASAFLTRADFDRALPWVEQCEIGGFQFEANINTIEYAITKTHFLGVKTFLDPSPMIEFDYNILKQVTYLKPNEFEASLLTGFDVHNVDSAVTAGQKLLDMGVNEAVIITLGAGGAVLVTRDSFKHYPAPKVKAIDTSSAGDTFAGGFLAGIAQRKGLHEAMLKASVLSSVVVSRLGTLIFYFEECRTQHAELMKEYRKLF